MQGYSRAEIEALRAAGRAVVLLDVRSAEAGHLVGGVLGA
jgi:hypothetical protein